MLSVKTHCAISQKRTGNNFAELHEWIDEPTRRLGAEHRTERHYHNENDKNYIKGYWDSKGKGLGEKAVIEWVFHIALDNLCTAFKMSRKYFSYGDRAYNLMSFGLKRSGYIHCDFRRVDEDELDSTFADEEEFDEDYCQFPTTRSGLCLAREPFGSLARSRRYAKQSRLTTSSMCERQIC